MNSVHMVSNRRERLKQEIRDDILGAARELFVSEGFANVSIRKVAERVGCAPGTIYLYFDDKDSILDAICVETFTKLDKRMEAIRNDKGDPLERLRRGGRAYIQFALDHPHHYLLTFGSRRPRAEKSEEAHAAGQGSFGCLRHCVQECADLGRLRSNDTEEVAQALWSCWHGAVMLLITKSDFPFIEQSRLIDGVLDMAIEGIRKH